MESSQLVKPKIVITGFDIFSSYKVNPSWEAVDSLKWDNDKYDLIKFKVPVTYADSKTIVKKIWNEYQPILVIHVGVSYMANCLTLEDCAVLNKSCYASKDVNNVCLANEVINEPLNYLRTGLDIDGIVTQINDLNSKGLLSISSCRSSKAGCYLCEYIYRCSLKHNPERSLFVHVPHLSSVITSEVLGNGLKAIIKIIIENYLK